MTDPLRPSLPNNQIDNPDDRRRQLNERLRAGFVEDAEEDSRRRLDRGQTQKGLERVLRRDPGDV
jgi:hypothetical protein